MHRDLNPAHILFAEDELFSPIRLIGFDRAVKIKKGDSLKEELGTLYYMAPEVLNGRYNEKCDIWSIGVILYVMIAG